MPSSNLTFVLSIYAALLATLTFGWRLYEFYYDRKKKLKITHNFYPNFLIGSDMFATICSFNIVNISSKKIIIKSIGYVFNNSDDTIYSPIQRFDRALKSLEYGESLSYDICYADFDNQMEETSATKFKLLIFDSTEKKYQTRWIRIKKFTKDSGYLNEMPRKNIEITKKD